MNLALLKRGKGQFNTYKSINTIDQINEAKYRSHIIISMNAEIA